MTKEYIERVIRDNKPEVAAEVLMSVWSEGRLMQMQEEREAWDRYVSAGISLGWTNNKHEECINAVVKLADAMLEERRKRFGRIK